MPARLFDCWRIGGREHCELFDSLAKAMLFDLHNLAPAIGQVNQLRSNDRYADLPKKTSNFGKCEIEDLRGFFRAPDCHKWDVARVGFYMAERYGVVIPPPEWLMFEEWSLKDSVSPWEANGNDESRRFPVCLIVLSGELYRRIQGGALENERMVTGSTSSRLGVDGRSPRSLRHSSPGGWRTGSPRGPALTHKTHCVRKTHERLVWHKLTSHTKPKHTIYSAVYASPLRQPVQSTLCTSWNVPYTLTQLAVSLVTKSFFP